MITGFSTHAETVTAQWQPFQVKFRYSGFTSAYSCEGINSKIEKLLLAMGARDDVRIENNCSGSPNVPQPFHNMIIAFALPVIAEDADVSTEYFPAEWQDINIRRRRPRTLDGGDCELVEQFSQQVLPQLGLVQYEDKTSCIPHKRNLHSPNLSMTVLIADEAEQQIIQDASKKD